MKPVSIASIMKPIVAPSYEIKQASNNYSRVRTDYNKVGYLNKPDYSSIRKYQGFGYSLN